jgi:hypothetical protein
MRKTSINLWELITHAAVCSDLRGIADQDDLDRLRGELDASARWNGQELSLKPTSEGWELTIQSCFSSDQDNLEISPKIVVKIPKNGQPTVVEISAPKSDS